MSRILHVSSVELYDVILRGFQWFARDCPMMCMHFHMYVNNTRVFQCVAHVVFMICVGTQAFVYSCHCALVVARRLSVA